MIDAHEFAWDKEHDPAWARYQKIWGFYDAGDKLASTHGSGSVTGKPPESTHCNNIGPVHRKDIHAAFEKWFGIKSVESKDRHKADELRCLNEDLVEQIRPKSLVDVLKERTNSLLKTTASEREQVPSSDRAAHLREVWAKTLGINEVAFEATIAEVSKFGDYTCERIDIRSERNIHVPTLLLMPMRKEKESFPVVICVCGDGKQRFLTENAEAIDHLLKNRIAVCLPDVRGTGETKPGDSRSRTSTLTSLCSTEQMLGGTLLGGRLNDVNAVFQYLTTKRKEEINPKKVAMWGESFAKANAPDRKFAVPHEADRYPNLADPTGGLLAAFSGLYHDSIRALAIRGSLVNYRSILESPFLYVPYDAIVPGAIFAGDLDRVYAIKKGRPLLIEGTVDGLNRRLSTKAINESMKPLRAAYGKDEAVLEIRASRALQWKWQSGW